MPRTPEISLTVHFPQKDPRRHRGVERFAARLHRDDEASGAAADHAVRQPACPRFRSRPRSRPRERDLPEGLRVPAARAAAHTGTPASFSASIPAPEVVRHRGGHPKDAAHRRTQHLGAVQVGAVVRKEDAADPECRRRAQDGASFRSCSEESRRNLPLLLILTGCVPLSSIRKTPKTPAG